MERLSTSPDRFKYLDDLTYKQETREKIVQHHHDTENSPSWIINNLEYDLRRTEWICQKVRNDSDYARKLYSTLCQNSFVKNDTFSIIKNDQWSSSWRHTGRIIADMIEKGDYMDWYCSGNEGAIYPEVEEDINKLGWMIIPYEEGNV